MLPLTPSNRFLATLIDEHRRWLAAFDSRHASAWERQLKADIEGACCEAGVRRLLQASPVDVRPNERLKPDGSGPDYLCSVNGREFYVEATCIQIAVATDKTGIPMGNSGPGPIGGSEPMQFHTSGMTTLVFRECVNKAKQCSGMDAPTLVAIGTFHVFAAMQGFSKEEVSSYVHGTTHLSGLVNIRTGESVGDLNVVTRLADAAFLKPDNEQGVGFARSSISALVLCNLVAGQGIGFLHPNPTHEFDREMLSTVEFGSVELDLAANKIGVSWPFGTEER